jgi:hypothetical protein
MGGYGSGQRSTKKVTVEQCWTLSAAALRRIGYLKPNAVLSGPVHWSNTATGERLSSIGFSATTTADRGCARLNYVKSDTGEKWNYSVELTTTPLPWGGRRWWFICPLTVNGRTCGRRVRNLYRPPFRGYFGCRHCYGLTYTSCQEAHGLTRLFAQLGKEVR